MKTDLHTHSHCFRIRCKPIKSKTNTEWGTSHSINFRMMTETNDGENAIEGSEAPVALALTSSPVNLDDPGLARKKSDMSPCRRSSRDRNVRYRFELLQHRIRL